MVGTKGWRLKGRSTHSLQDGEIQRYTIGPLHGLGPQFIYLFYFYFLGVTQCRKWFPLELGEQPWAWVHLRSELLQVPVLHSLKNDPWVTCSLLSEKGHFSPSWYARSK